MGGRHDAMPDSVLAARLGCTPIMVLYRRRKLGVRRRCHVPVHRNSQPRRQADREPALQPSRRSQCRETPDPISAPPTPLYRVITVETRPGPAGWSEYLYGGFEHRAGGG
jgi:hypothetical protein